MQQFDTSPGAGPWAGRTILDHASDQRSPADIDRVWRSAGARLIQVDRDGRFDAIQLGAPCTGSPHPGDAFLGLVDGMAWFARLVEAIEGTNLREARLDDEQLLIAAKAVAITRWQIAARHCERCGGRLVLAADGFAAHCANCGRPAFPRTDPAIIVAVLDSEDRLLLAHQGLWETGRVSILAGFVESGESAEQAVVREVREESRVEISALRPLATQPWPFPRSLMLGFVARGEGAATVDGVELEWGEWFTRAELSARVESGELRLPMHISIARRIIEAWLAGSLPAPEGD